MTAELPTFDKESVYDHEISPLVTKIIEVCKRENMPLLLSVTFKHDAEEDASGRCTTHLPGDVRFHRAHAMIINGGAQAFAITVRKGE